MPKAYEKIKANVGGNKTKAAKIFIAKAGPKGSQARSDAAKKMHHGPKLPK